MDQNRNQPQENKPQGNRQPSKPRWDGVERRTGADRRDSDTDLQMNEGSSR
jgi:hypothetical protein